MRRLVYIPVLCALVLSMFSCGRARVIPRKTFSRIMAEMLISDQWLKNDRKLSRVADTSDVYYNIFAKYGYDVQDYRKSVVAYMDNPEEFARTFEDAEAILNAHVEEVKRAERLKVTLDSIRKVKRERVYPVVRLPEEPEKPYMTDSLYAGLDTCGNMVLRYADADTMFLGPMMVIKDSILRRDSLQHFLLDSLTAEGTDSLKIAYLLDSLMLVHYPVAVDTLSVAKDSLALRDSLAREDSLASVHADSLLPVRSEGSLQRDTIVPKGRRGDDKKKRK